jgi:pimeloyl-ACP methyl ester carboxylesterase
MRRLLIFLHGYDPRGGATYYKLYRDQAAKQAALRGQRVTIGTRAAGEPLISICEVDSDMADGAASTRVEFQHWDDIVRGHWARGDLAGILEALRYGWLFLRTGHFIRVLRLQRNVGLLVLFPFLVVLAPLLLLAMATSLLAISIAAFGWPWSLALVLLPPGLFASFAAIQALDRRSQCLWLARALAFYGDEARGRTPDYDRRKDELAARLVRYAKSAEYDEILVVGHSIGATLAVSILARAFARDAELARRGAKLALLTVGQSIPVLARLPQAGAFRSELLACSLMEGLEWVDVSAKVDAAAFFRLDPVAASGIVRPAGAAIRPRCVAAPFRKLFSGESYARMKKTALVHQLYLLATERPGSYDFFEITAGALPLDQRFRGEPPRPVSSSEAAA